MAIGCEAAGAQLKLDISQNPTSTLAASRETDDAFEANPPVLNSRKMLEQNEFLRKMQNVLKSHQTSAVEISSSTQNAGEDPPDRRWCANLGECAKGGPADWKEGRYFHTYGRMPRNKAEELLQSLTCDATSRIGSGAAHKRSGEAHKYTFQAELHSGAAVQKFTLGPHTHTELEQIFMDVASLAIETGSGTKALRSLGIPADRNRVWRVLTLGLGNSPQDYCDDELLGLWMKNWIEDGILTANQVFDIITHWDH